MKLMNVLAAVGVCLLAASMEAQATFDAATKVFRLDGGKVTYAFGVNERGELQSVYWGGKLGAEDALPKTKALVPHRSAYEPTTSVTLQEYAGWGQGEQFEPALKVTLPDGNRDLVLHYVSNKLTPHGVDVLLKDISRDVYVTLRYSIDPATGILARSADIDNKTGSNIVLEQAASAAYALPRGTDYVLHFLTGRWASEWQMQTRPVTQGETVLESRIGSTSAIVNPWFAIGRNASVNERQGDVYFGELGWSGSWRITVQEDTMQQVRITGGYNPFDFGYLLKPGESLTTPTFYAGHTSGGYGEASRLLHTYQLAEILPGAPNVKVRPVLYNSWEATEFAVTEQGQETLAEKAASVGVERFVMDDGWFGQRKDDHAGLGDWYVNKEKFPNGLKPLIDKVHSLHMDFGLWVEPEMVNPDSDLYRAHPDLAMHFDGRPRTEGRNQLVLNLAMPEVRAYVFGFLDKLVSENDIAFLKWDYNKPWSEPGWPQVPVAEQKRIYVAAVDNYYSILKELRAKHPHLQIESCASGGGRVDMGVMRYTEEVWTSDNTDAFDRLWMQDGFSHAYTPGIMMAWVTDVPKDGIRRAESLPYRFLVAMQGSLGIGNNLNNWTPQDFATAKTMVAAYKEIRPTIQHGAQYRLVSPDNGSNFASMDYVSPDKKQAVLFAYVHSTMGGYAYPRVYLEGLDPAATYTVSSIYGKMSADTLTTASGDYFMHHGVDINLHGDFQGAGFILSQK
ncbi:MAG: alpha-galactosidase [Bryocella sp.]